MNKTMQFLVLLLSISGSALADDAGILRCRGIAAASARLACYDALVVPAAATKAAAGKPAAQPGFGLESRAVPGTVDAIESYIPGRFEGWEANTKLKLANGQVWQIIDSSSRYLPLNNPKVVIRRGVFGAFYLEFEKSNYSPRVKRVQ